MARGSTAALPDFGVLRYTRENISHTDTSMSELGLPSGTGPTLPTTTAQRFTELENRDLVAEGIEVHATLRGVGPVRITRVGEGSVSFLRSHRGVERSETTSRRRMEEYFSDIEITQTSSHATKAEAAARELDEAFGGTGSGGASLLADMRRAIDEDDVVRVESFPETYADPTVRDGIPADEAEDARAKVRELIERGTPLYVTVPSEHLGTVLAEGIRKRHKFGIKGTLGAPLFGLDEVRRGERGVLRVENVQPSDILPIFIDAERDHGRPHFRGIVYFSAFTVGAERPHLVQVERAA